ncbi:ATP-dependent helicase [bacterium]
MQNLLEDLNAPQKEAVIHTNGPLLILAGAGSGKTRVITHRIAYLISQGIQPYNILAVTFTNKAAQEMKERVNNIIGPGADFVTLSTFHSFCAKLLRNEAQHIELSRTYSICDAADQKSVVKQCIKELNLDDKKFPPDLLVSLINKAKDNLISSDEYNTSALKAHDVFKKTTALVYELYQNKLKSSGNIDFGGLLLYTVKLFEQNTEVLEKYRLRFQYIMVDEYQDTNHAQYMLIKLLSSKHKNICVVGDDDQSIYSWRGANIRNILEFEHDYKGAKVIKLEQNYRSTQNILNAAWAVVRNNTSRKDKQLWTNKQETYPIKFWQAWNEQKEADNVAREIERLTSEDVSLKEIAVFYRTHAQSRVLEDALRRRNIPYLIIGSVKFYARKEIKDILAYLKFLINKNDSFNLLRIINVPARGIGDTSIKLLESYAQQQDHSSLFDVITKIKNGIITEKVSPRLKSNLTQFCGLINNFDELREQYGAKEITKLVIEQTGYLENLRNDPCIDSESRIENVMELVSAVGEYEEATGDITLEGFLEHACLITDMDSLQNEREYVTLMTIHLAKGLEFPVVFMTGMEEGLFPHINSSWEPDELEEERRLCYVGMTRSQERLYLTCASQRKLYGHSRWNTPSRFIRESGLDTNIQDPKPKTSQSFSANKIEPEIYNDDITYEPIYEENNDYELNIKDTVKHADFGTGKIIDIYGANETLTSVVEFQSGQVKRLLLKYAKLKKL